MIPSISQRSNYCFDAYELCPLFYNSKGGEETKRTINEPNEAAI
jgi:hypothetical protein